MAIQKSFLAEMRALVSISCANYQKKGPFGVKDFCWIMEKTNNALCVFFSGEANLPCRYFELAVLPLNEELEEIYSEKKEDKNEGRQIRYQPTIQREGIILNPIGSGHAECVEMDDNGRRA